MYKVKLEKFEGPLDLLLELIEQARLDITEISLARITNQYLKYIENTSSITARNLTQFLVIAAQLIFLKSRALVPKILEEEEEEDLEELQKRLSIYQKYRKMAKVFVKIIQKKKFFLSPRQRTVVTVFCPPKNFSALDLKENYLSFMRSGDYIAPLNKVKLEDTISIEDKMNFIKSALTKQIQIKFSTILNKTSKTECIVSFLAILEMVKAGRIFLSQESIFGEIVIERGKSL